MKTHENIIFTLIVFFHYGFTCVFMSLKHYTELFNHLILGWGYSSTGNGVDSCMLGDGNWKVMSLTPSEDT